MKIRRWLTVLFWLGVVGTIIIQPFNLASAGANARLLINEFYRAGTLASDEWAELVLLEDTTATDLQDFYVGDSTASTAAKFSGYRFASMGDIASLFLRGTIIVIGGATQDVSYNPAGGDWTITLTIAGGHLTGNGSPGDFATTDVVYVDTDGTNGNATIASVGFAVNWDSTPGTLGSIADVTIAVLNNNNGAVLTSDRNGATSASNWTVNVPLANLTPGQPNGGSNTTWIESLRASGDTPPSVTATTPANGATGVATDANLTIQFSESVNLAAGAVSLNCGSAVPLTGLPANDVSSITLTHASALPESATCTASVLAALVTDNDGAPNPLAADTTWSFTVQSAATGCSGLFFSEYIEGSSNNKAVEIFNGTGSAIDLSAYQLALYSNGATSPGATLTLEGSLSSSDVYVVAHTLANATILGETDQTVNGGAINFNGDDAIALRRVSDLAIIDVIGQVGNDPGSEWGSGLTSTADNTLRRKASITTGDTNASDTFDPAIEWDGYATDAFDNLGMHSATCSGGTPTTQFIHTVQGNGTASPLVGQNVTIQGIVVGDFQDTVGGFFVQEEDGDADSDPLTSEGIFVYANTPVSIGDQVQATGSVTEYYNETELTNNPAVTVINSGNPLPSAASITLPVADVAHWERYEGMRVAFPQTLVVAETYQLGRGGVLSLADQRIYQPTHTAAPGSAANAVAAENARHIILLDDGSQAQNPDPIRWPAPLGLSAANTVRGGYQVSGVQGILTYRWNGWDPESNAYRIYPTTVNPTFAPANARPTTAPVRSGQIRVASFNVLNYFNGDGLGGGFPTSRGASTPEEFTRQRNKIINAILALNADIIGLMEIENDGYGPQSALQDLVNGLNAVAGPGTYALVNAGTLGSDVIKVAVIYRPAAVTPGVTTTNTDAIFSRPPLAQTFTAAGQTFTVIVNHLKSKGCTGASGLDADQLDGQGCYNATRTQQAAALAAWITTLAASEPDILLIGDYNAYARENPITTLTNAGYSDLPNRFWGSAAYSYVFNGQLGYLDHALASASLLNQVTFASQWHMNADEPIALDYNTENKTPGQISDLYAPDAYRSSDHDPVIVDLFMPCSNADASDLTLTYGTAWHCGPHTAWLGAVVNGDASFLPGTDNADDDGVERLGAHWQPNATVGVHVTVGGSGDTWLTGWFDWNLDGDFDDTGEKTINQAISVGPTDIYFTVPADARVGLGSNVILPSRFRLYESATEPAGRPANLSGPGAIQAAQINGATTGGEVEDYDFLFGPTAIELNILTAQPGPIPWRAGLAGLALLIIILAVAITRRLFSRTA